MMVRCKFTVAPARSITSHGIRTFSLSRTVLAMPWTIRTAHRKAADSMDFVLPSGKRLLRDPASNALPRPKDLSHLKKSVSDSLCTCILPFGSDAALREQYSNAWGNIRVGMLFEEIDAFAGSIAYMHCDDSNPATGPITIVTASMDRLDLLKYPLPSSVDLVLRGAVTYTGSSSLNIDVDLCTLGNNQPVMQASATFVARGLDNKAVPVPVLVPQGAWEEKLWAAGKAATEARKRQRKQNLLTTPPTPSELSVVHNLFTEMQASQSHSGGSTPDPTGKRMYGDQSLVTTVELTQPTDKNVHGKVFGGFLMRKAFEVAFAAAWRMTGCQPKFLALDDVSFLAPVEVGTLLRLDAQCNYAHGPPHKTYSITVSATMQTPGRAISNHVARRDAVAKGLRVQSADAPNKDTSTEGTAANEPGSVVDTQLTNLFHFTFYSEEASAVPRIYPRTYGDAMSWIGAHRRSLLGRELAEHRKQSGGPQARFPDAMALR